ncbi:preprotein translocase subunit SecE [Anaerobaca lacustris]|uniref:Protein translocase subunit SecE n=1 Tax=Anaerobaca lacustris TaxID=3044600 RepID=A0AAW6TX50_9BACT|nr:preprotein translocase subunit SecE [Sedimentisphaerales bacterium M17dextr]
MLTRIYKSGQGKYTRLCSGFAVAAVVAFGCWRLYQRLGATDLNLWVVSLVPVGVFAGLAGLIYWLLNKPSVADFMIAAEGELKKVNWSSRREVAVSTVVVIIVVVFMAALLGTTDLVFQMVFGYLLG